MPVNVSNGNRGARFPSIAVGPGDKLHLVWQALRNTWKICYSEKSTDAGWSVPETIAGESDYVVPKLAVDESANVHVLWLYGGYHSGMRYAERTGGTWSPQTTVVLPDDVMGIALAADSLGNTHALWHEQRVDTLAVESDLVHNEAPEWHVDTAHLRFGHCACEPWPLGGG